MSLSMRTAVSLAAVGALGLAAPAVAGAATKPVDAGTPASISRSMQRLGADANDFFPRNVRVHVGDRVSFRLRGFHTVDFPERGGSALPVVVPSGQTANASDAAGNPFWFNGQPVLGFNPALGQDLWGQARSYNGSSRVNSGIAEGDRPRPFRVRFTRTGTFNYFCDIHPGMKGTVRVVGPRKSVPSTASDRRRARSQANAALRTARSLTNTRPPTGAVDVGSAGRGGVEIFAFFPARATVSVGTTLRFQMTAGSRELHTATTGPGGPDQPNSYLGRLAGAFEQPVIDPIATYPSDQPPGPASLTPTLHGNGFWNSGAIDANPSPLPNSAAVRFDAAGTYRFICLVHPFMNMTVTVQ